jgi:hypothetical protein
MNIFIAKTNMMKPSFIGLFSCVLASVGIFFGFYVLNSLIDLNLIHHFQQPLALADFDCFVHDIKYPAGLSNYAGTLLSDLWGIPYLGEIVTLFLFVLIPVFEYIRLYRYVKFPFAMALSLSIFALLMVVFTDYYVNSSLLFVIIFSYLSALLTRFLYNRVKTMLQLVLPVFPIVLLVYLSAGSIGLMLYTLLTVFSLLVGKNINFPKVTIIGIFVTIILATPLLLSVFFYPLITIPAAFAGNFALLKTSQVCYLGIVVILISNLFIIERFKGKTGDFFGRIPMVLSIIAVSFVWLGPALRIDKEMKLRIEIDYLAYTRQWEVLLKKANPQLMHERKTAFQINRALYYTGGLLENLFNFPQYLGNKSLLLENDTDDDVLIPVSDIYYDMGYLNESRHWANESLTRYGKQPRILKRLAQINIIYGNYNGAKKYITLLKKTYSHNKWALEQEQYLFNDEKVKQNPEYATLIKLLPKEDFFATKSAPQLNLVSLNKYQNNKMVFEYLMAFTLLEHNVARLVKNIDEFRVFNFEKLPGNVEQALGIYMAMTHSKSIPMAGYAFSETFNQQFHDYSSTYLEFTKSEAGAKIKLDQKYRNTYWYYIHFVSSNAKK